MKKTNALITILTAFVVLLVANFLASRHPIRLDLTDKGVYTLSGATKKILKGLDDIVTVRVYFTQNIPPQLQSLKRDVDDILSEFKGAAGSRLQIEFVDPGASKLEEQKAAMLGIPPVQLNVVEKDKQEVAKIYLGMVVMFGDKQQVIPVVQNINNLEYELAEAVIKVSSKELPKVAWWEPGRADVPEGGGFSLVKGAMEKRYAVTDINGENFSDLAAKNFSALVLASPHKLSDDEMFALDQYLMDGGRILALIDRWEVGPSLNIKPVDTNAVDLFINYGVTVEDSLIADRASAMASFSGGYITYHVPYPFWPELAKNQFNQSEPIVAPLETAVLTWTSPLVISETGGGAMLASSSEMSVAVPGSGIKLDPQSAGEALIRGPRKSFPIIALMNGPFKSYFSGERARENQDSISESKPAAKIFVVGSSRWVSDMVVKTFPVNGALFENALDSFAMGDALIGIRSRENTSRPIEVVSDGARVAIKYINLSIGPVFVLAAGLIFFLIRRSRRRAIQMIYQ